MGAIGIAFLDRPSVSEQVRLVKKAEELGYASAWVCETRLARDAISVLGAFAAATDQIRLGSGVVNTWTRGPALMATTFATLDNLAPDRMMLGVGSYWDPLAWKQGIHRQKPLRQMREYISIVRRLLALEQGVTHEGELVKVRDLSLDLGYGDLRSPPSVPIYIGATGPKMMELTGEVADGALINGLLTPDYVQQSLQLIKQGARRASRSLTELHTPALVNVAMAEDGAYARGVARRLIAMYLGQQPHIAKASGLPQSLIDRIRQTLGGWPPRSGGVEEAMNLVDDAIVESLSVAGTPEECQRKLKVWSECGISEPIILPLTENYDEMLEVFARWEPKLDDSVQEKENKLGEERTNLESTEEPAK